MTDLLKDIQDAMEEMRRSYYAPPIPTRPPIPSLRRDAFPGEVMSADERASLNDRLSLRCFLAQHKRRGS